VRFHAAAVGFSSASSRPSRILRFQFPAGDPGPVFGSVLANALRPRIPFFTVHGRDPGAIGGGHRRDMRDSMAIFSSDPRGLGIFRHHCRSSRLHHRHGGGAMTRWALISMPVMIPYCYNMRYITGVLAPPAPSPSWCRRPLVLIVLAATRHVGWRQVLAHGDRRVPDRAVRRYTSCSASSGRTTAAWCPALRADAAGLATVKNAARHHPSAVLIFVVLGP